MQNQLGMKQLPSYMSREIAYKEYPDIFVRPKAEYMTSVLYKLCTYGAVPIWWYVGLPYFDHMQDLLSDLPSIVKHEKLFTNIFWSDNRTEERKTDYDSQIRDHAILDVVLNTKVWGESYLDDCLPFDDTQDVMKYQEFKK